MVYPPNPPAVGHSETIGIRTALYFILVAISIITAVTAALIGRKLADRWDAWHATLVAIAGYLLVIIAITALLPAYNEVPADFPASVLYEFRIASLITQLALWGTIGVILGELLYRLQRGAERDVIERDYSEQAP